MEMDAAASHEHSWLSFSLSHQPPHLLPHTFSSNPSHHSSVEGEERVAELHMSEALYSSELTTVAAGFSPEKQDLPPPLLPAEPKKNVDSFGQRTSIYRGVTRHRWTGRYEAHLWDNSCRREGQNRKGRQVYLGGYDKEEKAARAYDLAALKYWGPTTTTNFPVTDYEKELEEMKHMTRQEFVASLRRKSSGFSRGASIYRGVTRHHQHGRWQARIGRVAGNKDLYLGTFSTEEEAAEAYDIAAIKFRGLNAVTNFEISRYDVESIINSNLPIGSSISAGRPSKASDQMPSCSSETTNIQIQPNNLIDGRDAATSSLAFTALPVKPDMDYWSLLAFHNQQMQQESTNQGLGLGLGFGVFSSGANLDFSNASAGCNATSGAWRSDGVSVQQQSENSTSTCSYNSSAHASQVAFGSGSSAYEVPPFYYYQQTAFQTVPIFGME
ncbi:hypothetical protein LUZ63_000043 [Rhynchospora breviuscula]|uniref:AP2/ERF domain-containing protein n=1 Tax=Rhynchospora breviuscula TaxID=2022672 RepID=A0A9Q0CVG1_9POAL|nr:hypothetical protein LUZ63_000043 [Rhynchospora breviuscula]